MSNEEVAKEVVQEAVKQLGNAFWRGLGLIVAIVVSLAVSILLFPVGILLASIGWMAYAFTGMRREKRSKQADVS